VLFFTPSHNNTHAPAGLWGPFDGGGSTSCNTHMYTCTHTINTNAHTHKGTFTRIYCTCTQRPGACLQRVFPQKGVPVLRFLLSFFLSQGSGYRWAERPIMLGALLEVCVFLSGLWHEALPHVQYANWHRHGLPYVSLFSRLTYQWVAEKAYIRISQKHFSFTVRVRGSKWTFVDVGKPW